MCTNILKNKNLISILISLIVHCTILVSMGIFIESDKKCTIVPIKLVSLQSSRKDVFKQSIRSKSHNTSSNTVKNITNKVSPKKLSNTSANVLSKNDNKVTRSNVAETYSTSSLDTGSGSGKTEKYENMPENNEVDLLASHKKTNENKIEELDAVVVSHKEIPKYPVFSRKMHEEGTVILLLTVKNGTVFEISIEKSSGFSRLDSSAKNAAKKWRFSTQENFMVKVPFSFKLSN